MESGADNQATVSLKPADVERVANLTVKYFPGNLSLDEESDEFSDRFLLTWDPPENLKAGGFEVYRSLDNNLLLTVVLGNIDPGSWQYKNHREPIFPSTVRAS